MQIHDAFFWPSKITHDVRLQSHIETLQADAQNQCRLALEVLNHSDGKHYRKHAVDLLRRAALFGHDHAPAVLNALDNGAIIPKNTGDKTEINRLVELAPRSRYHTNEAMRKLLEYGFADNIDAQLALVSTHSRCINS